MESLAVISSTPTTSPYISPDMRKVNNSFWKFVRNNDLSLYGRYCSKHSTYDSCNSFISATGFSLNIVYRESMYGNFEFPISLTSFNIAPISKPSEKSADIATEFLNSQEIVDFMSLEDEENKSFMSWWTRLLLGGKSYNQDEMAAAFRDMLERRSYMKDVANKETELLPIFTTNLFPEIFITVTHDWDETKLHIFMTYNKNILVSTQYFIDPQFEELIRPFTKYNIDFITVQYKYSRSENEIKGFNPDQLNSAYEDIKKLYKMIIAKILHSSTQHPIQPKTRTQRYELLSILFMLDLSARSQKPEIKESDVYKTTTRAYNFTSSLMYFHKEYISCEDAKMKNADEPSEKIYPHLNMTFISSQKYDILTDVSIPCSFYLYFFDKQDLPSPAKDKKANTKVKAQEEPRKKETSSIFLIFGSRNGIEHIFLYGVLSFAILVFLIVIILSFRK